MSASLVESNIFNIPLSPPSSPRLSSHYPEPAEQTWQPEHKTTLDEGSNSADGNMALVHAEMPIIDLNLDRKPLIQHHSNFPYTLNTARTNLGSPLHDEHVSPTSSHHDILAEPITVPEMPGMTFGGSAPASPLSNLTPVSPGKNDVLDQDLSLDMLDDDLLDEPEKPEGRPMTAAEIRNQKRKMKRFRLTHNQTRFLMSEFARQAHPDAAHRERLAREIPGLSPRQVQVWFQNRRAKLKRLTSDDRERMMRSRALPDDFDMTQALHSPFGATHNVAGSMSAPTSYTPAFPEGNMIRPLNLDALRRLPDSPHSSSPSSFAPSFPGAFFTPPQSVTDTMSPLSPAGDSPFTTYSPTLDGSPRRNPFATSPTAFTSHPSIPRLQMHDRPGSVTSSPLLGGSSDSSNMMPYGLGLSYIDPSMQPFTAPSPTQNRMRSYSNNMPRRMELNTSCANNSPYGTIAPPRTAPTPQSATFPPYSASPLQASYSMLSAPHHVTSFPNSYMRPEVSPVHQDFGHPDGLGITADDDDEGSVGGLGTF